MTDHSESDGTADSKISRMIKSEASKEAAKATDNPDAQTTEESTAWDLEYRTHRELIAAHDRHVESLDAERCRLLKENAKLQRALAASTERLAAKRERVSELEQAEKTSKLSGWQSIVGAAIGSLLLGASSIVASVAPGSHIVVEILGTAGAVLTIWCAASSAINIRWGWPSAK